MMLIFWVNSCSIKFIRWSFSISDGGEYAFEGNEDETIKIIEYEHYCRREEKKIK